MQMDDIQSWWEVPSIAHFCSLFRAAFNLLDFDIEELEEALLTDGTEDSGSSLLQELIVRLLCGCLGNHDISTFNYQMFLRRLFRQKCQEYGRDNPFNTDMDFQFLPLRTKVEILHALCDFRLDADDVQDLLKNLESDSLRVEPLGHDENNSAYWYFYGTRLYREDYPKTKKKTKEKRRKGKDEKKRKKHGRSSLDLDGEEKGTGVWQVVCFTEQDWDRITEGFKDSRSKAEKELYHTLSEDFLPEIPRLFAEKERLQRKRLLEYQPRRQSSRLEKLKQQKEEEESLQKTMEKEEKEQQFRRKQEQENKDKGRHSRNVKERASRVLVRSQSRTTSECGSTGSFVESAIENKPTQSTTFVGRQTNNSLSSATGQIVIQGLRRKLRSSQVFRQTEEDLQTGMYKILEFIKNHEDAWPFLEPVDEQYAPKYYSIITTPMDLQQMEDKLDDGEYMSFCEFKSDFQLIVNNCQKYNGTDNEYTEMVGNLQEAFQLAVDRYLESEPSSDEEVAVEFIEKAPEKVSTPRNNSRKKKKKEVVPQHEEEEEEKSSSLPPSMPPSPTGSDGSDKIPDAENDFEDKSDEPIEAPDSDESSTKDDGESKSCANNNNSNNNNNNNNSTKRKKKSSGAKNGPDIEALELATEQTLKDINKWLDDTPRYSEFSSASNSPSHFVSAEEFEVGSRVENEYRRNNKVEKPSRSKDSKDNSKKRSSKDSTKQMRRREVQRTIERLQPGKSKGNLISNIQNVGKVSEEGPPGKPKETRSCLFPVVDETTPKLSLGTVLGTDVLGFGVGQNKHNFDAENKEVQSVSVIEETPKTIIDVRPRTPEVPLENENMEEYTEKKDKEEMEIKSINKDNRQEKVMPNLSAWFKAFGAPKPTSGTKKRAESLQDGSSVEIISEERKNVSNIITVDLTVDKTISVKAHSVIVHDMPRQPVVVNPRFEDTDSQCSLQQKSNEDEMPSLLPLAAVHQGIPRQRKVSTGSNISERSSFSQDLMDTADGSSPHLSLDDRLNSYPAPYPSPLHQSPVSAATSVITSPRPEEGPKFASYPPLNGTIRVGFYQDTSFSQQKSSPEKSSNSSHSPKDQVHTSYPAYNPRMYPPHDPDDFLPYQNQRAGSPPATVESYENSYVSPLMTYYDTSKPLTDQYRAARTQETEVFSPNSTTEEISAPLPTICSSPQHSVEVIPFTVSSPSHASVVVSTVVQKPSVTVFPVKKRLYSEMESNGSVQSSGRYHVTPPPAHSLGTPPPAHSQSASRIHPSESLIVIDNSLHSRPICTLLEDSDKIVASSSEKLYNSKVSPICEPSLKKAEHMSKKHQSIRTLQSTAHIAFGSVDRLQQSSPETITEYPEKSSNPHRFSPSIKHTGTQPTQSYVSRSNSVRKHISVIPENSASFNEESPNSARIRHSNVPVITTHVSNPPSHQEYNSKLERPITIERSNKTASTLDNVQPVTESCRETTRSSRLHTSNTCSSPTSVHDRLKPNTTATLHGDMSYHRGPFSPVPPSPLGMEHLSLHGNLSNLSHVVDRFPASERLLSGLAPSTPPYYNEKNLTSQHVFRQTVSSTLPTSISPSTAMALLSQPSPAVMTITYNHESQISPSSMPFNRSVPELPSVLPNKVSNMQASYGRSVQDLSGMLPTKDATPITAPTSFNRSVPDLQVIHTDKVSSNVNSTADYRSVTDLSSVISTKVTSPVDLKTYNQSVTDLSTVLPNKVLVPSSIGVPSSFTRSAAAAAAADYSLLSGKASDSQLASKPTRKRKSKQTPVTSSDVPIATTTTSSTAFQQYVGLNSSPNVSEPSAIALKTATVLTGSAFNFGSAHSGLGLYSTDKDGYPAYLEDYRTASSSYYIPAPDPNHDKINPASHPSAPTPSLPFPFTSHPRPPSYALAQAFINQSGLVDPTSTAPPLYQQYLHRHPEELLRHSGTSMVLHQGLLPPASYPPGYHPALGIRQTYDTLNRPTWL